MRNPRAGTKSRRLHQPSVAADRAGLLHDLFPLQRTLVCCVALSDEQVVFYSQRPHGESWSLCPARHRVGEFVVGWVLSFSKNSRVIWRNRCSNCSLETLWPRTQRLPSQVRMRVSSSHLKTSCPILVTISYHFQHQNITGSALDLFINGALRTASIRKKPNPASWGAVLRSFHLLEGEGKSEQPRLEVTSCCI